MAAAVNVWILPSRGQKVLCLLLVLGPALFACQRKAPGVAQCVEAAERIAGFDFENARQEPARLAKFQSIVRRCLVSPFDRSYLDCLNSSTRKRQCLAEYRRRAEVKRLSGE